MENKEKSVGINFIDVNNPSVNDTSVTKKKLILPTENLSDGKFIIFPTYKICQ